MLKPRSLYCTLLRLWRTAAWPLAFGDGDVPARLLSVFCSLVVIVLLYDTAEGRPRLSFTDLGVARYSAPLTWTDFGDDYELVSSAGTAPYYLAKAAVMGSLASEGL